MKKALKEMLKRLSDALFYRPDSQVNKIDIEKEYNKEVNKNFYSNFNNLI